jgi:hypothetical protein
MPRIDVGGQFVMTAVEILDEGVSRADDSRPSAAALTRAWAAVGIQPAVICLDRIVNRYERSSVAGLAGRSALGGVLVGIRRDRPGQGRWE